MITLRPRFRIQIKVEPAGCKLVELTLRFSSGTTEEKTAFGIMVNHLIQEEALRVGGPKLVAEVEAVIDGVNQCLLLMEDNEEPIPHRAKLEAVLH